MNIRYYTNEYRQLDTNMLLVPRISIGRSVFSLAMYYSQEREDLIQESICDGIIDSFDIVSTYRLDSFVDLNKLDNLIKLEGLASNVFLDIIKVVRNEREKA